MIHSISLSLSLTHSSYPHFVVAVNRLALQPTLQRAEEKHCTVILADEFH